jgi:hypothetical protein
VDHASAKNESYHSFFNDEYIGDVEDSQYDDGGGQFGGQYDDRREQFNASPSPPPSIEGDAPNEFDDQQYYEEQRYEDGAFDRSGEFGDYGRNIKYHSQDQFGRPTPPNENKYNHAPQSVPVEEYDEYADDAKSYSNNTTYSDTTHQASNVQQPLEHAPTQEAYDDEDEESISNIFKSLSDIQTRLATKGKTKAKIKTMTKANARHQQGLARNTAAWDQPIVEDASVDGSQVSSFAANASRNRRPQHGEWMEPVDEA